jgi:quercetin dioxygenase-like cupin family protein
MTASKGTAMPFYHPEDRETKEIFPGIVIRSFWGEHLTLGVADLDAGTDLPSHSHPHEQAGIVLEGEIEFTIADETKTLKPGDIYVIPGSVEHSAKVGSAPVRVLDIFSPVRDDWKY